MQWSENFAFDLDTEESIFPNTSIILLHLLRIINYCSFLTNWKPLFSFYTKTFKSAILIIAFWPAIFYII